MASRRSSGEPARRRPKPATTSEEREKQLSAIAFDVAEEQMLNGTASSQVITHFLRAGSLSEQLSQERTRHEVEMLKVRQQAMADMRRQGELYEQAIRQMRIYQGVEDDIDEVS